MPAGPIGSVWAAGSWSATAWEQNTWAAAGLNPSPAILGDFTTLLALHMVSLYALTPDDFNTLITQEIPSVMSASDSLQRDLNTEYSRFLS